jgi:hypothetical protein
MNKNTHSSKRILIEDAESLKYLGANGRWTKSPEDGASFEATRTACAAAKTEPIGKFNIVRYFPSTEQFINMDYGIGTGKETDSV